MGEAKPEKTTQFEKALLELRLQILNGEFEPNSRLPEIAISEKLGISRTPLRQAMARLVEEGLLERLQSGGCRVASFSMDDILDAIELRGVMEGTAARLAAERGPIPELAERCKVVLAGLDEALADPEKADFESYVKLNAEFHELLSRLSGSRVAQREVERAVRLPLASPSAAVELLCATRKIGMYVYPVVAPEFTNWRSEQACLARWRRAFRPVAPYG
jgi:GntR family transcriptional regulator of vanillate catabolism